MKHNDFSTKWAASLPRGMAEPVHAELLRSYLRDGKSCLYEITI